MSTIVYSTQERDFVSGFVYRNPRYFERPLGSPDKVIIIGNFPKIRAAYEALDVEVETVSAGTKLRPAGKIAPPQPNSTVKPSEDEPRIGKGPGGRFYIKSGKESLAGPYTTEEEANEALTSGSYIKPKED